MKTVTLFVAAATMTSAVIATPHRHGAAHRHFDRRTAEIIARDNNSDFDGPTVVVYMLNGQEISKDEVDQCVTSGKCVILPDSSVAAVVSSAPVSTFGSASVYSAPAPSSPVAVSSVMSAVSSVKAAQFIQVTSSSPPASSATPAASPSPAASAGSYSSSSSGTGVDQDFPDGQLSCSTFPSQYGAVAADWLQLGGWTGIQTCPGYTSGSSSISEISTGIAGSTCQEGDFCSYACPAGFQKSQWPSAQGSTGQSVGGIWCNGGKLHLTNSALSTKLCIPGAGNVNVANQLSSNVAVCRTDYPGTEGETVPLDTQPGSTMPVTCPDASSYYTWGGAATSAQYYINPSGVSVENACQWGSAGSNKGNWAPVNMGVGKKDGATWISLFQNAPTNPSGVLDFKVKIVGDNLSGSCAYENGQYTSETGSNTNGCTVQVMSGTATYQFYN